jgi:hypothetical protein
MIHDEGLGVPGRALIEVRFDPSGKPGEAPGLKTVGAALRRDDPMDQTATIKARFIWSELEPEFSHETRKRRVI